ncbi:MAG: N-6 DNA methylase [Pirellulales bacterium]|nr:N-6 DNA methylase [Pirellulales bacterium]
MRTSIGRRKTLSAGNLARDFGGKGPLAATGVRALHEAILAAEDPSIAEAQQRWQTHFGTASGHDLRRPSPEMKRLAKVYGTTLAAENAGAVLFALHTYYATITRLLVARAVDCSQATIALADFDDHPFAWCLTTGYEPVERLVRRLVGALSQYDLGQGDLRPGDLRPGDLRRGDLSACDLALRGSSQHDPETASAESALGGDVLGPLYQELFPRPLRHKLGEYYTPDWLADHVLDILQYPGGRRHRLLDPACGSGTFLMAAIRRLRARCQGDEDVGELGRTILGGVVGFDLNPLAVMTARANYLIAIRDLLPHVGRVEIPVYLCDSILDGRESAGRFDCIAGNPPWIAWDNLADAYRRATRPLWEHYGLFSLAGKAGRHGGAKKDLSMLMLYVSADRYLKRGGRLAMVITQTLFQSKGAGDGFRRFRLGREGDRLNVLRVDDLVALRPFQDAANWTSTILLEKGSSTQYPVPYVKWSAGADGDGQPFRRMFRAEPIEPELPSSPWFLRPEGFRAELRQVIGPSDYTAHLGANSGGANGVFWLQVLGAADGGVLVRNLAEKSQRGVEPVQQVIEPDLLYPLARWADVGRYGALPSAHILLAQNVTTRTGVDEATMRRHYPRTFGYLKRFERVLTARAAYRRYQAGKAFYSMYNIDRDTVAPIKVVWRRMDRRLNAAVVCPANDPVLGPRPVIPQETCVLIACDSRAEAHFVCGVLNSTLVDFLVRAHSVRGGKGFGTPSMLDFIKLPRFRAADPRHRELAKCSRQAHATAGDVPDGLACRIDRLAAELWGLDQSELDAIRKS